MILSKRFWWQLIFCQCFGKNVSCLVTKRSTVTSALKLWLQPGACYLYFALDWTETAVSF